MNKYKISRRGRKLQTSDDLRTLLALPKDVPERTWAEILQKEENELVCLDVREMILEEALRIGYEHYMERQNAPFVVHCAAQAWLKLINWQFYRHDPGEDPTAYPPCYIPRRKESWIPDQLPQPSPKDSWGRQVLEVIEPCQEPALEPREILSGFDVSPLIEDIPSKFWFPGRVNLTTVYVTKDGVQKVHNIERDGSSRPNVELVKQDGQWRFLQVESAASESDSANIGTESEVLQRVTDYGEEQPLELEEQSLVASPRPPAPSLVDGSLRGAGDSTVPTTPAPIASTELKRGPKQATRTSRGGMSVSKIRNTLPPLASSMQSLSAVSGISDCRLRNLRLDTHYEISTEKFESTFGERPTKRDSLWKFADKRCSTLHQLMQNKTHDYLPGVKRKSEVVITIHDCYRDSVKDFFKKWEMSFQRKSFLSRVDFKTTTKIFRSEKSTKSE